VYYDLLSSFLLIGKNTKNKDLMKKNTQTSAFRRFGLSGGE